MSSCADFSNVMRAWGRYAGYAGSQGGWIYHASGQSTGYQGWHSLFSHFSTDVRDWATRQCTAFDTFRQMVEETGLTYRPTIMPRNATHRWLADQYDQAQKRRNDPRRAWRGH